MASSSERILLVSNKQHTVKSMEVVASLVNSQCRPEHLLSNFYYKEAKEKEAQVVP